MEAIPAHMCWGIWTQRNEQFITGKFTVAQILKLKCLSRLAFWLNFLTYKKRLLFFDNYTYVVSSFETRWIMDPPSTRLYLITRLGASSRIRTRMCAYHTSLDVLPFPTKLPIQRWTNCPSNGMCVSVLIPCLTWNETSQTRERLNIGFNQSALQANMKERYYAKFS